MNAKQEFRDKLAGCVCDDVGLDGRSRRDLIEAQRLMCKQMDNEEGFNSMLTQFGCPVHDKDLREQG